MTSHPKAQVPTHQPSGLPLFRIRPYHDTDEAFVVVSWAAELAKSPTYAAMDYDLAFQTVRPHVRQALSDLRARVAVVVPADAEEPICGFSVVTEPDGPGRLHIVHHLHVKGPFRKQGLMTDLLAMQGIARGQTIICATDTRDIRGVMANGTYDIRLRPDLILTHLNPGL